MSTITLAKMAAEQGETGRRIFLLLGALGIDSETFEEFLEAALSEHLVNELRSTSRSDSTLFGREDALHRFRTLLENRTQREWSEQDYKALFERVQLASTRHDREPVSYEDLLRLLAESALECAVCHIKPPEAVMHIDHIFPASKGGTSHRKNLQFLCQEHNLSKSNRVEMRPWLRLNLP